MDLDAKFDDVWESLYLTGMTSQSQHADRVMRTVAKYAYSQGCRDTAETLMASVRKPLPLCRHFPGFELFNTGGDCTALRMDIPGGYVLITADDDAAAPVQGQDFCVGVYDADSNEVKIKSFPATTSDALVAAYVAAFG